MSWRRPAVIAEGDSLVVRNTTNAEYRMPFTFVEALNEGALFDRPARIYEQAAREHYLFEVVNTRTEALIGTCILQRNPNSDKRQVEVGGMMIHPSARHIGLNTLLTKAVMVRELCATSHKTDDVEFVAHVIDGNEAPVASLVECGFRACGRVIVRMNDIDADLRHMIDTENEGVVMQSYTFERSALIRVAKDLRQFLLDGSMLQTKDISLRLDLSALLNLETISGYLSKPHSKIPVSEPDHFNR